MKSVSDSTEAKIADECTPGKPITVFTAQPHEVGYYGKQKLLLVLKLCIELHVVIACRYGTCTMYIIPTLPHTHTAICPGHDGKPPSLNPLLYSAAASLQRRHTFKGGGPYPEGKRCPRQPQDGALSIRDRCPFHPSVRSNKRGGNYRT